MEQADSELRVLLGLPSSPFYSGADIKARNHIWLSKLMQQKYLQTDVNCCSAPIRLLNIAMLHQYEILSYFVTQTYL